MVPFRFQTFAIRSADGFHALLHQLTKAAPSQ